MKYLVLALAFVFTLTGLALAEQQFNPFTGKWVTVPDNWNVQYNPFTNDWTYQPDDAQIEYNPFKSQWDWDSGNNPNVEIQEPTNWWKY